MELEAREVDVGLGLLWLDFGLKLDYGIWKVTKDLSEIGSDKFSDMF